MLFHVVMLLLPFLVEKENGIIDVNRFAVLQFLGAATLLSLRPLPRNPSIGGRIPRLPLPTNPRLQLEIPQ